MINPYIKPKLRPYFEMDIEELKSEPIYGPEINNISTTTVNNIEEYIVLCKSIENNSNDNDKILYRGQTRSFLLPGTNQISLLPSLARVGYKKGSHFNMMDMINGCEKYLTEMVSRHINVISPSNKEANRFRRLMEYNFVSNRDDYFSKTPIARFLKAMYSTAQNPFVFEAFLQHYGFPTLNLDVTYSPLVAMYFATHKFRKNKAGVFTSYPSLKEGSVYILNVPKKLTQYTREKPELEFHDGRISFESTGLVYYHTRQNIADLFDLILDNDCRARRQYAALLTEVGNVDISDPPQLNAYAKYINHIVYLTNDFWNSESANHFFVSNLGDLFFPAPKVDLLFQNILSKSPDYIPIYDFEKRQYHSDPNTKFEFMNTYRIVLTGSDASEVFRILEPTWHGRLGKLQILPKSEVFRLSSDSKEQEKLDIVVACEPELYKAERLNDKIVNLAYKSGRFFVTFPTGHFGDSRPYKYREFRDGGIRYSISEDPYDFDFSIQQQIFSAMLLLSKARYNRRMKPDVKNWRTFINF